LVQATGKIAQVSDDVQHELVVRTLPGVEEVDFLLQQREQAAEVHVVGTPGGYGIVHPVDARRGPGRRFDPGQARLLLHPAVVPTLRKIELGVLAAGGAIAVAAVLYAGRGAFQANTAWTEGAEKALNIALTLGALAIVIGVALLPYVCLYFLGRFIPADARVARAAGLIVSLLTVLASGLLYFEATSAIHGPGARSTAPILFALFPAFLLVAGAVLYIVVIAAWRIFSSGRGRGA
jgi:hypothetical protein